jgi:hypothetical protein
VVTFSNIFFIAVAMVYGLYYGLVKGQVRKHTIKALEKLAGISIFILPKLVFVSIFDCITSIYF